MAKQPPAKPFVAPTPEEHLDEVEQGKQRMVKTYYDLCDARDALYTKAQPLEDQLTAVNLEIEGLRQKADALSQQIDLVLGTRSLLSLKKRIREAAEFLRSIPPRPAA